jgi:hypothetical protein
MEITKCHVYKSLWADRGNTCPYGQSRAWAPHDDHFYYLVIENGRQMFYSYFSDLQLQIKVIETIVSLNI